MNGGGYVVFLGDDALCQHLVKLPDETLDSLYCLLHTFDLNSVPPGVQSYAIGVLDQPEVFVHVAVKARQRQLIFYRNNDRSSLHYEGITGRTV